MKKIIFEFSEVKTESKAQLLKEMAALYCRIQLQFDNRLIEVQNVKDEEIDKVIDIIDKYFSISKASVENDAEGIEEEMPHKLQNEQSNNIDCLLNEELEKINNERINEVVNEFLKTISWAMNIKEVQEKDICQFIWTSMNEISMKYNDKEAIKYEKGDIVDCNFGRHPNGEASGGHILSIVCNVSKSGYAFVVPTISYFDENETDDIIIEMKNIKGCKYPNFDQKKVLIGQGRYVNPLRFNNVIGKLEYSVYNQILEEVAKTFDFTKK